MSYFRYLREHAGWIAIWLFLVFSIEIFMLTMRGASGLMLFIAAAVTVGILLGTYLDYRRIKKFLEGLEESAEGLDQKYLLPEMLQNDGNQEEEKYKEIIRDMEHSMADHVAEHRRRSDDYKEYVETWVHEVKIPIAAAKMLIENHKNEPVKEVGIDTEIGRIQDYVEQALFFARSEAVEKDYMIREIDMEELVYDVISDKRRILREKRAGIDLHDLKTEKKILSDKKWLAFIISQIIDNSIKYAKEEETLRLEIFLSEDEKGTMLTIQDNGVGMKTGEAAKVFDKGFTGTNGRNMKQSTGMGLYLCKKLCTRLEHEIKVQSVEGEGTALMILFK